MKKQKSRRETSNRARVCTLESEKERVKERVVHVGFLPFFFFWVLCKS